MFKQHILIGLAVTCVAAGCSNSRQSSLDSPESRGKPVLRAGSGVSGVGVNMVSKEKKLTAAQSRSLLKVLEARFKLHPNRHKDIAWKGVSERLSKLPAKLWSLFQMENSGGEPDVVSKDCVTGEILFFDCSEESPKERRSLCYDRKGLESRKKHLPDGNAIDVATAMGCQILSEIEYLHLQGLGDYDKKSSCWLLTPDEIRSNGGAIFGELRYGRVFIFHNGAQSYYRGRGFRTVLRV